MVRILCFHFMGSISDQETRIPQAMQCSQKKKKKKKKKKNYVLVSVGNAGHHVIIETHYFSSPIAVL